MPNSIIIKSRVSSFKKEISVSSDKSISIRNLLLASQAIGKSKIYNLLNSEDVQSTIVCLKKLGIKIKKKNKYYEVNGKGLNSFSYKNNTVINANNSGTLARLILGLLAGSKNTIVLKGDKSLSKRDFSRVIEPLNLFGVKIHSNNYKLPIKFKGTEFLRPIKWNEMLKSAQVKSCIMFAALNTPGNTKIIAKISRDHTERLFKFLKIPVSKKNQRNLDLINIKGQYQYRSFISKLPGDISSASFFLALTLLTENSELLIKNVNVNKTRTGIIDILKMMNAKIIIKNKRVINGEEVANINIKSSKNLIGVSPSTSYNSRTIDELPLIFLICAKAKGVSYFKDLGELRHKEQDRLKFSTKFLKMIGVKVIQNANDLKIFGNPKLKLNGKYILKNYMKDHRAFMMASICACTFGGNWKLHDKSSIRTSFPNFLNLLKFIGAKIN